MRTLIPMAIGAGVVFGSMIAALVGVGVVTAKVTDRILEEILD